MFFDEVPVGAPDPIFGMQEAFAADVRPKKVNLMVGVFKDEHLRSELMPVVRQAKQQSIETDLLADYLPFEGIGEFGQVLGGLVFGKNLWAEKHGHTYVCQAVGGTGALRVGAEFLAQEAGGKIYVPHPTYANHRNIFEKAGCIVETIPYYNSKSHQFDLQKFLEGLRSLESKSIVVFHAACHNPTGSDPTWEEWKEIAALCKEKSLLPFFDFAYQGFGSGIEEDAKAVRLFFETGQEMLVAYSCSKNFSLYCQRVGALFVLCPNAAIKSRVGSQIKRVIRSMYSNPPAHGARIVLNILKDPHFFAEWQAQIGRMRNRIATGRQQLLQKLLSKAKKTDFSFLQHHKGMFSYLDLNKSQVQQLIEQFAIYTLDNGRINVAGITLENIDLVTNAVMAVCEP